MSHAWLGNNGMNYEMGGTILSKTREGTYRVTMNAKKIVSEQCRMAD